MTKKMEKIGLSGCEEGEEEEIGEVDHTNECRHGCRPGGHDDDDDIHQRQHHRQTDKPQTVPLPLTAG